MIFIDNVDNLDKLGFMNKVIYLEEVVKRLGISRSRYYHWERAGKIPKPKRDPMSGYRIFSENDVNHLMQIKIKGVK